MGYYMSMRNCEFTILNKNKQKALESLKEFASNKQKRNSNIAWSASSEIIASENLVEAFEACRYGVEENENGDIFYLYFNGEKLGDDEEIFNAIAPAVEDGSFIEMQGENGYLWRWVFQDGKCREIAAKVIWDFSENTMTIDIGFANLVAEKYFNGTTHEFIIYIADKETNLVTQDITLVRKAPGNQVQCLVWHNHEDESYTHKFTMRHYSEEDSK